MKLYPGMWYRCPKCNEQNFVEYCNLSAFNCIKCSIGYNCKTLYEAYNYPHAASVFDNLNMLASKFTCDCGKENIVFTKSTVLEYRDPEYNKRIEGGEAPRFGLCEECFTGYNLEFVHPFV